MNIAILYSAYESALLLQQSLLEKKQGFTIILMPLSGLWENLPDASLFILSDSVSQPFPEKTVRTFLDLYPLRLIHLQMTEDKMIYCPGHENGFSMEGETLNARQWAGPLLKRAVRNCMVYNHYSHEADLPGEDMISMLPFRPDRGTVLIIRTGAPELATATRRLESGVLAREGFCCFLYDSPWLIMTAYLRPDMQGGTTAEWKEILNIPAETTCYIETDLSVSLLGVSLSRLLRLATRDEKGHNSYYPQLLPVLKKFREKFVRTQKSDWEYFMNYCFQYIEGVYTHKEERKQALLTFADAVSLDLAAFFESRGQIYQADGLFRVIKGSSTFYSIKNELKHYLLPALVNVGELKQQGYGPVILKAINLINEQYGASLGLASAADELQVSPQHLSRLFSEQTGSSFTDYLLDLRLEKAKELLLSSTRSIKEICFEVGFQDPNYFSKMFKKRVGIPPREYKEGNL